MKSRDMASVALHATFVCLAVLGFAVASPSKPVSWPAFGPALTPMSEPPFAAAYVAAYARGDEATAEQVASPLYRLEWARRGVSVADRQALIPVSALDSPSGE